MKHKIYQGSFKKSYDILIQSTKLNSSQKLLIQLVLSWQGEEKQCFQTNKSIAESLGLSIRGLDKIITSLNKLTFFQSRKNEYNNGKLMTINENLLFDFLTDNGKVVENTIQPIEQPVIVVTPIQPIEEIKPVNKFNFQIEDIKPMNYSTTTTGNTMNFSTTSTDEILDLCNGVSVYNDKIKMINRNNIIVNRDKLNLFYTSQIKMNKNIITINQFSTLLDEFINEFKNK